MLYMGEREVGDYGWVGGIFVGISGSYSRATSGAL